jgi:hypothetical protein
MVAWTLDTINPMLHRQADTAVRSPRRDPPRRRRAAALWWVETDWLKGDDPVERIVGSAVILAGGYVPERAVSSAVSGMWFAAGRVTVKQAPVGWPGW